MSVVSAKVLPGNTGQTQISEIMTCNLQNSVEQETQEKASQSCSRWKETKGHGNPMKYMIQDHDHFQSQLLGQYLNGVSV